MALKTAGRLGTNSLANFGKGNNATFVYKWGNFPRFIVWFNHNNEFVLSSRTLVQLCNHIFKTASINTEIFVAVRTTS